MAVADGAQTRTAIIKEVTQGTTPATPAFKNLREVTSTLNVRKRRAPSDSERRSDRMLGSTYRMVGGVDGRIDTKLCEDDALDILFESLMCNTWSTDNLKNASTKVPFTIEKTFEQGASDTYLRGRGCMVNSMSFSGQIDQEIQLGFDYIGMTGATDSAIIAGATYAAASTKKCHTVLDSTVGDMFSLTVKMVSMNFTVTNGLRPQPQWTSADPFGIGLGRFRCDGQSVFYFEDKAQLDAAFSMLEDGIDVTFGETTAEKYQFIFNRAIILDHEIQDGGNDNDVFLQLSWAAEYNSGTTSQLQINRNVA